MNRLLTTLCLCVLATAAFGQTVIPDGNYAGEGAANMPTNGTVTEYCYNLAGPVTKVCPQYNVGGCGQAFCDSDPLGGHCKRGNGWDYQITSFGPDRNVQSPVAVRANGDAKSKDKTNPYHCYNGAWCVCTETGVINNVMRQRCVSNGNNGPLSSGSHDRLLAGCKVQWYAPNEPNITNTGYGGEGYGDGEGGYGGEDSEDWDQSGDYGGEDSEDWDQSGDYGGEDSEDWDQSGDYGDYEGEGDA